MEVDERVVCGVVAGLRAGQRGIHDRVRIGVRARLGAHVGDVGLPHMTARRDLVADRQRRLRIDATVAAHEAVRLRRDALRKLGIRGAAAARVGVRALAADHRQVIGELARAERLECAQQYALALQRTEIRRCGRLAESIPIAVGRERDLEHVTHLRQGVGGTRRGGRRARRRGVLSCGGRARRCGGRTGRRGS